MNENMDDNFAEGANSESPTPSQPNSNVSISRDLLMKIGVGALSLVVVLGLIFVVLGNRSDSRISDAVAACGYEDSSGITMAEDGQTLLFDGRGDEDYIGADFSDVECLLTSLEAPSTIYQQMLRTSSLMGLQNANWDGISVSWSYHPNSSLFATFKIGE